MKAKRHLKTPRFIRLEPALDAWVRAEAARLNIHQITVIETALRAARDGQQPKQATPTSQ